MLTKRRLEAPRGAARSRALARLVAAGVLVCLGLDWIRPVVTVDHTGAFIGAIIAGIVSVFSWIGGHAVTVVVTIAQAAVMIATAIAHFAVQVGLVFAKLYDLLAGFYRHALQPFVRWSLRQIDRLQGWLERTFRPLIEFLEKVRRQIDAIYSRWFKPIFDTIDATRRILQLLAWLRVPFARELDAALAKLEARLLWPLQQLYYRLNEVIGWIDRIVTLDGFFQRVTWVRSQWRYVEDSWRALVNSRTRSVTDAEKEEVDRAWGDRTHEDVRRDLADVLTTGDGYYGPGAREIAAMFAIAMRGT